MKSTKIAATKLPILTPKVHVKGHVFGADSGSKL